MIEDLKNGDEKRRRPNFFYYCVPWYLSAKVYPLLPDYAGLIAMCAIVLVKKPPVPQAGSIKTLSLIQTEKAFSGA